MTPRYWHGTRYVMDMAFEAGVSLGAYYWPGFRYWKLIRVQRWRVDFDLPPFHAFLSACRSRRWLRRMTAVQIKWHVVQAFGELAKGQRKKE